MPEIRPMTDDQREQRNAYMRAWNHAQAARDPEFYRKQYLSKLNKNPQAYRESKHRGWMKRRIQAMAVNLRAQRKRLYGLDQQAFEALLESQNSRCAICEKPLIVKKGRYAIDHDHSTGKTRGILCVRCNNLIGKLEQWNLCRAAYEYLVAHEATGYTAP